MKISLAAVFLPLVKFAAAWEQIERDQALLAIVDLQVGLFHVVRDFDPAVFKNAMYAHAELATAFELPVIMATSTETGPNGPLPQNMVDMFPNATIVQRKGEINAWDSPEFREAVEKSGKKHIILAGIMTDVCTTFVALSLREAGYSVWANAEASGTTSTFVRDISNDRMARAGVHVVSWLSIVGDLMRDWRSPYGAKMLPYYGQYQPQIEFIARAHLGAMENGELMPGEDKLDEVKCKGVEGHSRRLDL